MNKQRLIEKRILLRHRIIAQRLRDSPDAILGHARNNLQRWRLAYQDEACPQWLDEWNTLLTGPLPALLTILTSATEDAARLRSSSPFAGIISARERWKLLKTPAHENE